MMRMAAKPAGGPEFDTRNKSHSAWSQGGESGFLNFFKKY
jgi:hypothetical protein